VLFTADAPDEMEIQTLQGVSVQLSVKSPIGDDARALMDSGFGYSQVLTVVPFQEW